MKQEEGKAEQAELFAVAAKLAQELEEKKAAAEADANDAAEAALLPLPGQVELEESMSATKEVSELYPALLELVKTATGATSCYIGVKGMTEPDENGSSVPTVTFLAGSEGSKMEGEMMLGTDTADDPDAPPPDGVTFNLFVGTPEENAEGEEVLVYPTQVVVPNVVRHPNMKFFGVPKLGSYVAVPMKYKSCLHPEGVGEAAEGEGAGTAAPAYTDCEMVLGMHTMGQAGRQFTDEQVETAKVWAGKVVSALERAELSMWTVEVAKQEAEKEKERDIGEVIAKAKAEAEAECEEKVGALPEDMLAETKEHEAKKLAYKAALKVMSVIEEKLIELSERRMPPRQEPVRILHAMLYSLLYPKEQFVEPATRKVNWEKMRKVFTPKLLKTLKNYDPSSEKNAYPRYARVEEMRRMLEIEELPPDAMYSAILDWSNKATDVREAAVAAREAEAEAEAAAAAAAEEME